MGAVQGFNEPWEQVLLHGQSRRNSRLPVIRRPGHKAASNAPILLHTPGLDTVPCCIQPGQPIFNEALIKTQLRLRAKESEGGSGAKTCHEGRCQTAQEVQGLLPPFVFDQLAGQGSRLEMNTLISRPAVLAPTLPGSARARHRNAALQTRQLPFNLIVKFIESTKVHHARINIRRKRAGFQQRGPGTDGLSPRIRLHQSFCTPSGPRHHE